MCVRVCESVSKRNCVCVCVCEREREREAPARGEALPRCQPGTPPAPAERKHNKLKYCQDICLKDGSSQGQILALAWPTAMWCGLELRGPTASKRGRLPPQHLKAHRLLYHSILGFRVIKKKKKRLPPRLWELEPLGDPGSHPFKEEKKRGGDVHYRLEAKREHLQIFKRVLPESRGQNLTLTVLHAPYSLDSG